MRRLCDGEWLGGRGLMPTEVGDLTPNQFWFLWAPAEWFRETDGHVVSRNNTTQAMALMEQDGTVAARAGDGTPIRLRLSSTGLSKAGQLKQQLKLEQAAERASQPKKKRTRRGT